EEDEVKITFIPFVKENKKKQKNRQKKDAECTSNARPSGRNWPLGLSIPDTESGQSLLKACSSGPEHDDHREEDLRRSEHVATKEKVMAVMEVSYKERRRKLGRSDFVSNMDVAAFTVVLLRRRRSESNCIRGGGERRRGRYNCEATFFEILIFEATFEKPKNSILNLDKLR
ncbi:unnamed protein product, partial [Brassica rapa subsp. trilocularis]